MWERHGFDLTFDRWETLNIQAMHCPVCGCLDRERLIALYIDKCRSSLPSFGMVIEFAPIGTVEKKLKRIFRGWRMRTADLFANNVDDKVDICDMPIYATHTVDLFICSHVIEHVADDTKAAKELFRILKPGGRGLLMVPIHLDLKATRSGPPVSNFDPNSDEAAYRWRTFGQHDHTRLHSHDDFCRLLRQAGFCLELVTRNDFAPGTFERSGISETSVLYVASKAL
jgi:SAM-dependent methyltransferase